MSIVERACPACGSFIAILLGVLGRLAHLRCRDCGMDFNAPVEDVVNEEDL